LTWCIM